MERETILYRGKEYHRYPISKRRQLCIYYWKNDKWKQSPKALHRQIYEDNYGEIPKGYIIHHKDNNPLNNAIDNLEILSRKKHQSTHMSTQENKKKARDNLFKYALPKSKEKLNTPEGKEWARKQAIKNFKGLQYYCRRRARIFCE